MKKPGIESNSIKMNCKLFIHKQDFERKNF